MPYGVPSISPLHRSPRKTRYAVVSGACRSLIAPHLASFCNPLERLRATMNVQSPSTHIATPYPGLRPFEPHEAEIFFGRGAQIEGMLAKLEAHRFLAVVGASGCGKSSLVRAGLLPALQEGFLEGGVTDWRMLIMRPAGGQFAQLAQAFHDAMDARPSPPEEVAFTETTLHRSPRGLVDAIAESAPPAGTHYLLLVDQFEELFRFRYREVLDQSTEAGRAVYEARNEATAFV